MSLSFLLKSRVEKEREKLLVASIISKRIKYCFMVSLICFSFIGYAQPVKLNKTNLKHNTFTTIYAIEIPGVYQEDKQGAYDKVLKKTRILNSLAILKTYPPIRAQLMFKQCTNCCFTPANSLKSFYQFKGDIVETDAINIAKIFIFVKEGQKPIDNLSALSGKNIGARTGMPYGDILINKNLNVHYVDTIEQNIKKLALNRIDAFIAYVPDAYNAFKQLHIKPLPHNKAKPLAIHPDRLVCKGVTKKLITTFNKNLHKLKQRKQLKALLGHSYIAP